MTYSKKYGNYGIYTDGMLYKWFKDLDKALDYWKERFDAGTEIIEEWKDEYDSIELKNMRTGEIIAEI